MSHDPRPWTLLGFTERLAAWVDLETIGEQTRRTVSTWIESRAADPYRGAVPEPRVEGLWWSKIPNSRHKGGDYIAICSYWINHADRSVRCDNFGSAPWTV